MSCECAFANLHWLEGSCDFFVSQENYADFHRAGRMCFIPKLLNCSK